jgi:hypothetical protein
MRMRNKQNNYKIPSKNGRTRGKVDTPNTQLHDHSLSWQYTYFNKKNGADKLFIEPKPPVLFSWKDNGNTALYCLFGSFIAFII